METKILNGGMDFLKSYRSSQESFLPMVDHQKEVYPVKTENGDKNIGWNCGLLEGNRPFFIECWVTDGLTILTSYISTKGIEDFTDEQVDEFLQEQGVYKKTEKAAPAQVAKIKDGSENEFYTVNVIVGLPDNEETFIEGDNPIIYPISFLNDMNR